MLWTGTWVSHNEQIQKQSSRVLETARPAEALLLPALPVPCLLAWSCSVADPGLIQALLATMGDHSTHTWPLRKPVAHPLPAASADLLTKSTSEPVHCCRGSGGVTSALGTGCPGYAPPCAIAGSPGGAGTATAAQVREAGCCSVSHEMVTNSLTKHEAKINNNNNNNSLNIMRGAGIPVKMAGGQPQHRPTALSPAVYLEILALMPSILIPQITVFP